jgi:hypothetical protein
MRLVVEKRVEGLDGAVREYLRENGLEKYVNNGDFNGFKFFAALAAPVTSRSKPSPKDLQEV